MVARAMWKGAICFGDVRVPVKFYAAVADQNVHFRLLHTEDRMPVKQAMVNPETGAVVPYARARRAYVADDGRWVMLDDEDLSQVEPEASRDVEVLHFLPPETIDHRWYLRPYYLGPDGADDEYAALIAALERSGREGLAHWVMRKKEYVGALRLYRGYPVLVSLRHDGEVVPAGDLKAPGGRKLDSRELSLARELISRMEADFEPEAYTNRHRGRLMDMIETKRRGGSVKVTPIRRVRPTKDVQKALEASLEQEAKGA